MKLVSILLITGCLYASAATNAQPISLSVKNESVKMVIREITRQSGYHFFYKQAILADAKKVTLDFKDLVLEKALEICFREQPFTYVIVDKVIVIKEKSDLQSKIVVADLDNAPTSGNPVSGQVLTEDGKPLVGASIQIKTKGIVSDKGTTTDETGRFTVSAEPEDILVVSYVGYIIREITIGTAKNIAVVLEPKVTETPDVVVTALGIKKQTKALTYNVQEVKGEEIVRNRDANFVNSLAGKIAGVSINPSSSGPGGATRVVMRGTKSINQNNNVLYVIDGIPMPNVSAGAVSGPFAGVVGGEGISNLNPEDIESISALTGPSAAALYGSDGANGVILITTKKGTAGKLTAGFSHSIDFLKPFVLPQFQNTYGQLDPTQFGSWGPKLNQPSGYHPKDFFQTGSNMANSINLSGGSEKSQTFFSAAANNSDGIIRNNTYDRYNFNLRNQTKLTDRITLDFGVMYAKSKDNNMVAQGQYHNPLVPIYLFPPGDDINKYKLYQRYDPTRKVPVQFWPYGNQGLAIENPYWITDAESNAHSTDRYMLNVTARYSIAKWLDLTGRIRVDNTYSLSETKRPASTDGLFASGFGYYSTQKSVYNTTYADLIATVRQKIFTNLNLTANIGGSYKNNHSDALGAGGNLTQLANFYSAQENTTSPPTQQYSRIQNQSAFATVQLEYRNWLFVDATGRQEWPSALPEGFAAKTSFFYPSIGVSGMFTDALHMPKNILSFGKLRFSYAEVGNAPAAGIANPTYSLINPDAFRPAPFASYQPERTKSFEAGIDLKFFRNKLNLSATLYKSNTTNQLLDQKVGSGAQYTDFYYNAGNIENKGIEGSLGYNFRLGQVKWMSTAVFSLNRNKIIRLSEGFKNPVTGEIYGKDSTSVSSMGDLENLLIVGGQMSDMYVSQILQEDNQGLLYSNPTSNAISKAIIPRRYAGYTTPDYTIGWRNNVSWRNFEVSWLVDARIGGMGVSYTQSVMDAFGVSKASADARDAGGVEIYGKKYSDVQGFYNLLGAASGGSVGLSAFYIYKATNVRLREASIAYSVPASLFKSKISNLQLSITGRNLFMFYNKSPFDPESTSSTGTYSQGIDYFRQPSYKSFGFSIRLQF